MARVRHTDTTYDKRRVGAILYGPCKDCLLDDPHQRSRHYQEWARDHGMEALEAHVREELGRRVRDLDRLNDYVASIVRWVKEAPIPVKVVPQMF